MKQSHSLARLRNIVHGFFGRSEESLGQWRSLNMSFEVGDDQSAVKENRSLVCRRLGINPKRLFVARQIHKTRIVRIGRADEQQRIASVEADGLWTTEKNLALGVLTADCAPVLLALDNGEALSAIHVGWRGAVLGIIPKAIVALSKQLSVQPQRWIAAIGPCIEQKSFIVRDDVARRILCWSAPSKVLRQTENGAFCFDLGAFIAYQLRRSGLSSIEIVPPAPQGYFSYRASNGQCGRQISFLASK